MILAALFAALLVILRLFGAGEIAVSVPPPYNLFIVHAIGVLLAVALAVVADRLIRRLFWDGYLRRRRKRNTPALIEDIVTVALIVLGISVGLFFEAGVSFTGVLTASGATAIVLGIALQAVIQDLFSGLSINMDGSYAIGDWLTIYADTFEEPVYGCVTGITWRTTYLHLTDGTRLIIPNRLVTANPVVNHSRPAGPKRLEVEVMVDNRYPAERVMGIILGEVYRVVRQPGLSATPEPDVVLSKFGQDDIAYRVRFYAEPSEITPQQARSLVGAAVQAAVLHHRIPMPVSTVELGSPAGSYAFSEKDEREALAKVPLFKGALDGAQLDALNAACSAKYLPAGTVFIRQGEQAASMFVLLEGAARVSITTPAGSTQNVAVLASGDVVGEMSLMTGAPRTATVTAITPLRVLEITKAPIESLLKTSPELLNQFGHVLARRQLELTELAAQATKKAEVELDLLNRMRAFFARTFGG